mgnify:CR=1 FL=1
MKIARGHWQAGLWEDMLRGEAVMPFAGIRGRAREYADCYRESFFNMLSRAEAAGFRVESKPGKLGGLWGSSYRIVR